MMNYTIRTKIYICLLLLCVIPIFLMGCSPSTKREKSDHLNSLLQNAYSSQNKGNFVQAERYHRQALEYMKGLEGFPSHEIARQLSNLASSLNHLKKGEEAEKLLYEAQEILKDFPSSDVMQYAVLYGNIAESQRLQGKLKEAEANYQKALFIAEKNEKGDKIFIASDKAGLALIWAQQGKCRQAEIYYKEALPILIKRGGSDHPIVKKIQTEYNGITKRNIELNACKDST